MAGTRGSRGIVGQYIDRWAVCEREGEDRHAASQDGPMVALGSVWLRLELVGTHVEGHRMIWKVNLREGAVEAGLEDSVNVQ